MNSTEPARAPPEGALTVAESFGTQRWAVEIDEATVVTVTSSSVSEQAALWVFALVLGELPLYSATQW